MTSTLSPTSYEPNSWQHDIQGLLEERDLREKAHEEIIDAYGRIASRLGKASTAGSSSEGGTESAVGVEALRADLATAQSSNAKFIAENQSLRAQLQQSHDENAGLKAEVSSLRKDLEHLSRRQKDYEAEAKERSRLTENLQDELVAAEIQLNMSEERVKKLEAENEMLVKRWMEEKGREADEMNRHFQ